ncbi:uncharacterized oxidoreductase TM_0325-like [Plodia interpunctella]|uniref:uncharacterized oxidoreductase TM_0325-like n=1 Tax=Plodia interpunctella TaxID=58824 RepID=UPI0031014BC4
MFSNKVVLVTGASSGIGAETAQQFSKLDALLVLTGRNKENLKNVADRCQEISPQKLQPFIVIADMNKESDIENIIKLTLEKYNKLDVLVNNAGVLESGTIETTSLAQYDRVINTNVRGPYYLTMLATHAHRRREHPPGINHNRNKVTKKKPEASQSISTDSSHSTSCITRKLVVLLQFFH